MGLGKTFTGSEKALSFYNDVLVVCQKSKIDDWIAHFKEHYSDKIQTDKHEPIICVYDLSKKECLERFIDEHLENIPWETCAIHVGVINYDLVFRRPELSKIGNFTLILDESSTIQNEKNHRAKFILKKLEPTNVILLSGTPVNGKYEKIWSQCHLLGWDIDKQTFEKHYCIKDYIKNRYGQKVLCPNGFPIKKVVGYKNVERLKMKLREHGAHFLKTEQVFDLPEQVFYTKSIGTSKEYRKFVKTSIVEVEKTQLVGDTSLTKMLYQRMLCGQYNKDKLAAFKDLIESTEERVIVFYNFNEELSKMKEIAEAAEKPISEVNGHNKNLENYEDFENSVTFVQYQSGAMGLNLQLANRIVYFTPPLSSELYEQSKKRIHRIGQKNNCFYYNLVCKNSIEEKIYDALSTLRDYTDELFKEDMKRDERAIGNGK